MATTHPNLAAQFHPTKNGSLTPFDIVAGSNSKFWWKCPVADDHEWEASGNKRVFDRGCPCCSTPVKKVVLSNCLATTHPEVAKMWNYDKNGLLTPFDVSASSKIKVWWTCSIVKYHEWQSAIGNRTNLNLLTGCPKCSESKGEKAISEYLNAHNIIFRSQVHFKSCKDKRSLPFDFAVKCSGKLALIEFNGDQHYYPVKFGSKQLDAGHHNMIRNVKHDLIKKSWCKCNNFQLLSIPYWERDRINEILDDFFAGNDIVFIDMPDIVKKYNRIREEVQNGFENSIVFNIMHGIEDSL